MRTLEDILTDVSAYVDLEASLPTGDELTLRANYANQAIWDVAAMSQFEEFNVIYEVDPSTLASISMPSGFKELTTAPRQYVSGTWQEYPEINPKDRYSYSSSDYYCYKLGTASDGYTLVFNNLTANATISIDYQRFPSGLLTLSDKCELKDPQFVVRTVESLILQSRGDDRFPQVEADAQRRKQNLIGGASKPMGGGSPTIPKTGTANYILE